MKSDVCDAAAREAEGRKGRRVNRIRSFVLLVCAPEKLPDRSAAC